jgi:hypothetical protein
MLEGIKEKRAEFVGGRRLKLSPGLTKLTTCTHKRLGVHLASRLQSPSASFPFDRTSGAFSSASTGRGTRGAGVAETKRPIRTCSKFYADNAQEVEGGNLDSVWLFAKTAYYLIVCLSASYKVPRFFRNLLGPFQDIPSFLDEHDPVTGQHSLWLRRVAVLIAKLYQVKK